jgi:hypothetical protein
MKHVLFAALLALACVGGAHAHGGAKAKHGGIVATASDLGFELVVGTDEASLYVEDHGKPLAPTGMSGKLTVLRGGTSSEAPLAINGDRLVAKVKVAAGAKVVASLSTAQGKPLTVRFTLK